MNQYKKSTNPFLSSPTSATAPPVSSTGTKHINQMIGSRLLFNSRFFFSNFLAAAQPQQQQQHQPILDLFGSDVDGGSSHTTQSAYDSSHKASDDLLQLAANPFATPTGAAPVIPAMPAQSQAGSWATGPSQNGFGGHFATDNSFVNAFGASANGSTNGECLVFRHFFLYLFSSSFHVFVFPQFCLFAFF